jgi:rhamnosyltransferase subunit B
MRYILTTDGTWGDVLPFMFMAKELKRRNHEVLILSNEHYFEYAKEQGIPFIKTTSETDRIDFLSNKELWDPNLGMSVVAKYTGVIFSKTFKVLEDTLEEHKRNGEKVDMILSHSFSYAAKTISELYQIPHASILISPIQLKSSYRLPVFYGGKNYNFIPHIIKKMAYSLINKFILDPLFPKEINEFRRSRGLIPIKSFVFWNTEADLTIGLWPSWYSPLQKDQTKNTRLVGFAKNVEVSLGSKNQDEFEKLEFWIKSHKKPILVTMGSGYLFNEEISKTLEDISKITEERFILVGPNHDKNSTLKSDKIFEIHQIPFSKILPLCKLAIHHGGAGTLAQVINSGIPHLVIPQSHDQPDNAHVIWKNSLGEIVWKQNPNPEDIISKITSVLSSKNILENCKLAKSKTDLESDGIMKACDLIENINKKA